MFVTETAIALPNCCIFCPGSARRRYIDTGLQQEFYGAVYICEDCVTSMGRMFGMITPDQVDALLKPMIQNSDETFEMKRRLAAAEEAVRGLTGMLNLSSYVPTDTVPPLQAVAADDGGLQGAEDSLGTGEGATSEQVHDEGVDNVRSDARSSESFDLHL